MSAADLLREVTTALDRNGVPYMLVGSFASTAHGAPRATQDIDVVVDPSPEALDGFLAAFDRDRIYVSTSAEAALAARDQFNLIDVATGWKVDLLIRKDRPFSRCEFDRREPARLLDVEVYIASAEDTVLAKLEWAALGGSDRQLADAAAVLAVTTDSMDHDYLDHWAAELGVTHLLALVRSG